MKGFLFLLLSFKIPLPTLTACYLRVKPSIHPINVREGPWGRRSAESSHAR
jgi:hypothetical protein